MDKLIDLTGQRFGRWTVLRRVESSKWRATKWLCQCDCGNQSVVVGTSLRRGESQSCGCLRNEMARQRFTTHGGRSSRLYRIYHEMKDRCYNKSSPCYHYYGGRGITICEEWLQDFSRFRAWALQSGYNDKLTIDRVDTNGSYSPKNCRWVTMKVQNNNKRNGRYLTFRGETHTVSEWADITGIPYYTLHSRIVKLNWSIERALTEKVH
jgi:hypothetical protein